MIEEQVAITRREIETGRVQVRLHTGFEPTRVQAELRSETVSVEHVPIGRIIPEVEPPPVPREEEGGALLVVPVLEEVLVVEKRLVLREEIRLRRRSATDVVTEEVTLRRQHAEVERLPQSANAATANTAEESPR